MLQDRSTIKLKDTKISKAKTRKSGNKHAEKSHKTEHEPPSSTTFSIKENSKQPVILSNSAKFSLVKSVPEREKRNTANMPVQLNSSTGSTLDISSSKRSEVELVSERITKTKRETEHLKEQLQKLINDDMGKTNSTKAKENITVKSLPEREKLNTANMLVQLNSSTGPGLDVSCSKRSEVELVSERITKTKREIEHLKEQLQKVINDAMDKTNFTKAKENITALNTELKAVIPNGSAVNSSNNSVKVVKANSDFEVNKAKTFEDNIANITGTTNEVPQQSLTMHSNIALRCNLKSAPNQQSHEESPKKVRHYDQEAAREYIKKQKERRKELMKNQKKEVTFTEDIRKQRLQELRKKSLQLVSKNIQQKRERSRSRSRDALDEPETKRTVPAPSVVDTTEIAQDVKGKIRENLTTKSQLVPNLVFNESKSDKIVHLPEKTVKTNNADNKKVKFAHPQHKNITIRSRVHDLSAVSHLNIPKHIQLDEDFPVYIPSDSITQEQLHKAATKIQAVFRGHCQRKIYRLMLKIKQQLKEQAIKSALSKEVQTSNVKNDVPTWLQAPTALPYPYNFINTVKRKLNLAIQQMANTGSTDVGVQSSLISDTSLKKQNESVSDRNENASIKDSDVSSKNKKSSSDTKGKSHKDTTDVKSATHHKNNDLKSFLSHKCLNLDTKNIEPLVITRNSSLHKNKEKSLKNDVRATNSVLKSEVNSFVSDSDTSKNIPEISSESSIVATSKQTIKRSHSDTDNDQNSLKINTDKVKKLKLRQPRRLNFDKADAKDENVDTIKSYRNSNLSEVISEHISNNTVSSNKIKSSSSSKHRKDSIELKNGPIPINSSRKDSIITYNKCDYSQNKSNKKLQNTVTLSDPCNKISSDLELKSSRLHSNKTKSETAITSATVNSIIAPQDTLISFREYMKNLNKEEQTSVANVSDKSSNLQSTIQTETENSSVKSQNKKTSSKTSIENVEVNSERSENSTKTSLKEKPQEYSSNFTSVASTVSSLAPSLKPPSISLRSAQQDSKSVDDYDVTNNNKKVTNLILKPDKRTAIERKIKSNEIHLKFEAELHLLNEFNDSLRQFMAVEKSMLGVQNNNANNKSTMTYETRDTQTSFVAKSSTDTKISTESLKLVPETEKQVPTINYSRGSDVSEHMDISMNNTFMETNNTSLITTGLEVSQLKDNSLTSSVEESNVDMSVSFKENKYNGNIHAGLSLDMFEHLIKDEDARIENLKTILKIREKALVDRTKGELAWLEIQKKHLRDSGQLQEISAIKKKQRGLLIKLEHERHEMQRLKQMQKSASRERKSVLKEQRNMIKAQLSNTNNMITKIKRNTKEDRRHSGPLKVYNIKSHSESVKSETSMSRRSSITEEIISVVSHSHSIVSHVTEDALIPETHKKSTNLAAISSHTQIKTEHVKRSLLMREAVLQKRRKAAEELLQWHQRLLEEEGKITELELAASAIINQVPPVADNTGSDEPTSEKHKFKGSQLNLLWYNMTGREENKFNDHMTYSMSKISLERFCKDAKKYALNRNRNVAKKGGKQSDSDSSLGVIKTNIDVVDDVSQNVVTELSHSRSTESIKTALSKSSSDEKSVQSVSSNRKGSSIIEAEFLKLLTKSDTNKDSQVTEYTSDFESPFSVDKESGRKTTSPTENSVEKPSNTKIQDQQQKMIECSSKSINNEHQPKINTALSSEVLIEEYSGSTDIIDEASWSDKENDVITTIGEASETRTHLISTAKTDERNQSTTQPEIKTTDSIACVTDSSNITEEKSIADEQSTDTHSVSENVERSDAGNIANTDELNLSVNKSNKNKSTEYLIISNEVSIAKEVSETNQNSTSKDVTTNIENDELDQQLLAGEDEFETEKSTDYLELNAAKNNAEIIKSSSEAPSIKSGIIENEHAASASNGEITEVSTINETTQSNIQLEVSITEEHASNELEDQVSNKTNNNQQLSTVNDDRIVVETVEDKLKTNENDSQLFSIADELQTEITENHLKTNDNEAVSELEEDVEINDNDLLSAKHEILHLSPTIKNQQDTNSTSDKLNNKINEDLETNKNQLRNKINDALSKTSSVFSDVVLSNKVDVLHKDNLNGEVSLEKTVENDDTEIISDDEWNNLSDDNKIQELSKTEKSSYITNETVPEINKNDLKENENHVEVEEENDKNSIKSDVNFSNASISKKSESPLLLSYGYVDEDVSEHEKQIDVSATISKHPNETRENDTSYEESNDILDINDESDVVSEKHFSDTVHSEATEEKHCSLKEVFENHQETFEPIIDDALMSSRDTKMIPEEEKDLVKDTSSETEPIDVKKRVSKILADANIPSPRSDKSPRLQDLYITAYDVVSPEHSSNSGSPTDDIEQSFTPPKLMYDEVEELLKKQLEIEQEIKAIQQQQQKEHLPYLFVREIPNKPPPPYTPPVSTQAPVSGSVLPASEKQIGIVTTAAAPILYGAYLNNNLRNVTLSEKDKKVMQQKNNIEKVCYEFIFDLSKEAAIEHYKQFETETGPSWMHLTKTSKLALGKPLDCNGLGNFINKRVRQWLGYEKVKSKENIKHKWSGKKRDHVDDLLVVECQEEEVEWTNYDRDELIVKDELAKDIMNMLLSETALVFNNILNKKTFLY